MKSPEIKVAKYFDVLLELRNDKGRFDGHYVGCSPFLPNDDEVSLINQLRKEEFGRQLRDLNNDFDKSLDQLQLLSEYLDTDFEYHFKRSYESSIMMPIAYNLDTKVDDRLRVISDLAEDLGRYDFYQYIKRLYAEYQDVPAKNQKLEWIATPSLLAHLMSELAVKGYIKPPRQRNGEINYTAFAKLLKSTFDGELGSEQNLRQALSPDNEKGLSEANRDRFRIPELIEFS
ncbi:hypothetical protein [Runella sp. SP2]|uniref:hypothetical protein n=1 Tax=Runella sp. SP2 TaxID=2268026 RepID=UPI000F0959F3|nr:hypothetical protein [Runella sp. SP2]AYQ34948.1 hypothetical protein DTQ70_23510 [Runella sp. SP2]